MNSDETTTYWDYLKIDSLLSLQSGIDGSEDRLLNDEVMFITVHQIDELWFKLLIRELVAARNLFAQNPVPEQSLASAVRSLRRITVLFGQVANHFALMETMTTRDYLEFRDKLSPASGFQSGQLREIELLLGLKDQDRILLSPDHDHKAALQNADGTPSPSMQRLQHRLDHDVSLREVVRQWVWRTPVQASTPDMDDDEASVDAFIDAFIDSHARSTETTQSFALRGKKSDADREKVRTRFEKERQSTAHYLRAMDVEPPQRTRSKRIRASLLYIESYRELPLLAWPREVIDALVELEQAFVIFRQRHARMVERIIGRRTGTGGSSGVDYLDQTALKYRVFEDLWAVRGLLIRQEVLPEVSSPSFYGFSADPAPRS